MDQYTIGWWQGFGAFPVAAFLVWAGRKVLSEHRGRPFAEVMLGWLRRRAEAGHRRAQWIQDVYVTAHGAMHDYRQLRVVAEDWAQMIRRELEVGDAERRENGRYGIRPVDGVVTRRKG